MFIKQSRLISIIIQAFLMTTTLILFLQGENRNKSDFIFWCRYGLAIVIVLFVLLCRQEKKVISTLNVFYIVFVLFQFGLPIIYAFDPEYESSYIKLFSNEVLLGSVQYTVASIQVFVFGLSLFGNSKHKIGQSGDEKVGWLKSIKNKINRNKGVVVSGGLVLFIFCAVFVIPINFYAAIIALRSANLGNTIGASFRGIMDDNAIFRFVQQLYFPSALLILCFDDKKNRDRVIELLYLFAALLMLVVADRSGGLTALVVYALFKYGKGGVKSNNKVLKILLIAVVGVLIVITGVLIAQYRSTGKVSFQNVFFRMIEEMGFNFTSICFVQQYIPGVDTFKLGASYAAAIVLLIPQTFDIFGWFPSLSALLGETWLYNTNILVGRESLSFGVGFSLTAESYYNFGAYGLICMFIIGALIAVLLKDRRDNTDRWGTYMRCALMFALFTLPRRQFSYMLKGLEYNVVIVGLYLLVLIYFASRKRKSA